MKTGSSGMANNALRNRFSDKITAEMTAKNKYIDAHLHLQNERFLPSKITKVMQRAEISGVKKMLCNATSEHDWQQVLNLASDCASVIPSLGVHPWQAAKTAPAWDIRLADLCQKNGALIGEIGLDKICDVPMHIQEKVFCTQLDIARQQKKIVSIHCLKSWGRLVDILNKQNMPERSIIIHSFSGSGQIMHRLLDLGALISFSTQLANPARKKMRQAFMVVPLDRMLLETDAPDQFCRELVEEKTPVTGQLNEPAMLPALYQYAAQLRLTDLNTFTQTLWNNGKIFTNRNFNR